MSKHQTAVEWLVKIYLQTNKIDSFDIQQAKQMEKNQVFIFFKAGQDSMEEGGKSFGQYYNETFKSKS